jgi:hypothetical protein
MSRWHPTATLGALLLTACHKDWLPPRTVAPRLRDETTPVGELYAGQPVEGWWAHWSNPDWLLVKQAHDQMDDRSLYFLFDADSKERTTLCAAAMGEPNNAAWRESVGYWDVLDDALVMFTPDGAVQRCDPDGTTWESAETFSFWAYSMVFAEGGILAYAADGSGPVWLDYATGELGPVQGPADALSVHKRQPDVGGLWITTHDEETNHLVLTELDGATLDSTVLLDIDLGDNELIGLVNDHADAFLFEAGDFLWAASATLGGGAQPIGAVGLGYTDVVPYSDGSGFILWLQGTSVDLTTGTTHSGGFVAYDGWHYEMTGDWAVADVTITANNAHGSPVTPYNDFSLDLSTQIDLSFDEVIEGNEDNRPFALGFANGSCFVGRDYHGYAMWYDGTPNPDYLDSIGWELSYDVFYSGACGEQPSEFSRELSMVPGIAVDGRAKHDVPIIQAGMGIYEGTCDPYDSSDMSCFAPLTSAWTLTGSGKPAGLWQVQRAALVPRVGGVVWTMDLERIYVVDAGDHD